MTVVKVDDGQDLCERTGIFRGIFLLFLDDEGKAGRIFPFCPPLNKGLMVNKQEEKHTETDVTKEKRNQGEVK